jgi:hypothetical protein
VHAAREECWRPEQRTLQLLTTTLATPRTCARAVVSCQSIDLHGGEGPMSASLETQGQTRVVIAVPLFTHVGDAELQPISYLDARPLGNHQSITFVSLWQLLLSLILVNNSRTSRRSGEELGQTCMAPWGTAPRRELPGCVLLFMRKLLAQVWRPRKFAACARAVQWLKRRTRKR